jgi:hypothetical protein
MKLVRAGNCRKPKIVHYIHYQEGSLMWELSGWIVLADDLQVNCNATAIMLTMPSVIGCNNVVSVHQSFFLNC